jgi:hypothetical protein
VVCLTMESFPKLAVNVVVYLNVGGVPKVSCGTALICFLDQQNMSRDIELQILIIMLKYVIKIVVQRRSTFTKTYLFSCYDPFQLCPSTNYFF